jgi:hypothetical protein
MNITWPATRYKEQLSNKARHACTDCVSMCICVRWTNRQTDRQTDQIMDGNGCNESVINDLNVLQTDWQTDQIVDGWLQWMCDYRPHVLPTQIDTWIWYWEELTRGCWKGEWILIKPVNDKPKDFINVSKLHVHSCSKVNSHQFVSIFSVNGHSVKNDQIFTIYVETCSPRKIIFLSDV